MNPTAIYVVVATSPDGNTTVHSRCFVSELAARCDAEVLAQGELDWLTRTYGMDEARTEFEVQQLTMWRYGTEHAA